jgi:hypothetical protein
MALTVRLPDALHAAGSSYAADLGISLNALLAVALRDYLAQRPLGVANLPSSRPPARKVPPKALPKDRASASAPPPPVDPLKVKAPASRSDPCPCGATDRSGYPVKYKHCHGRP